MLGRVTCHANQTRSCIILVAAQAARQIQRLDQPVGGIPAVAALDQWLAIGDAIVAGNLGGQAALRVIIGQSG